MPKSYGILLVLHLLAAIAFVGTVFFEVVILEGVRRHLPQETMRAVERTIGNSHAYACGLPAFYFPG